MSTPYSVLRGLKALGVTDKTDVVSLEPFKLQPFSPSHDPSILLFPHLPLSIFPLSLPHSLLSSFTHSLSSLISLPTSPLSPTPSLSSLPSLPSLPPSLPPLSPQFKENACAFAWSHLDTSNLLSLFHISSIAVDSSCVPKFLKKKSEIETFLAQSLEGDLTMESLYHISSIKTNLGLASLWAYKI